ncbi:MAG TPA: nuclear transport factor 2 family protein [Candidatus Binatia bacterium]|nr:nuclear transport factor 2 family protein [Candidatus Binatia bacterium]
MSLSRAALGLACLLTACGESKPEQAVRAVLAQWPRDWNARNVPAVCGLFAPDVVLSFPGGPDRDHATMCRGFTTTLARTDRILRYDAPEIEDVFVDGDLAAVRLVWTLRITGDGLPAEIVEKERGLDVFQRQSDGTWKIRVSYAYPDVRS